MTAWLSLDESESHRSRLLDRVLVFLLVFSIYFEANLPFWGKASTPFLLFGITVAYLSFFRLPSLFRIISSRYFLASMAFATLCTLMESIHPRPMYEPITRFINMSVGVFCIAVMCRDRKALDVALFAFILASALQSVVLIAGTLNLLRVSSADGLHDATRVRIMAFEELFLKGNLNEISYFEAIGAIIGVIWSYYEKIRWRKIVLLLLTIPSILGVFLPASRTGALLFFLSLVVFAVKSNIPYRRYLLSGLALTLFLLLAVPGVVWVRLGSVVRIQELKEEDSRMRIYSSLVNHMDDYVLTGVGAGEYWNRWAIRSGITNRYTTDVASAAHNAFFQVWIFWGLPALLAFLYLIHTFYRAVDSDIRGSRRKSSVFLFVLMIPVIFLVYHSFYHKTFSIGLGLLLASRWWNLFDDETYEARS